MALWGLLEPSCMSPGVGARVEVQREATAEARAVRFCETNDCKRAIALTYTFDAGELADPIVPTDDGTYELVLEPLSNVRQYWELATEASAIEALVLDYGPERPLPWPLPRVSATVEAGDETWSGFVRLTWSEVDVEPITNLPAVRPIVIRETTLETSIVQVLWRSAATPVTVVADLAILPGFLLFPLVGSL